MNENIKNSNLKRKGEKIWNKRWTDNEVQLLLQYLQTQSEFEKPTAQIFYRKFLKSVPIDASWEIVRWKVKNLKTSYNKAEAWRKLFEAGLLQTDGAITMQEMLRKMCRFYDELNQIFGQKNFEFPFQINNGATTKKLGLGTDRTLQNQVESGGSESLDNYSLTQVMQYTEPEAVAATEDDVIEVPTSSAVSVRLAKTLSLPQESRELQQKNKTIQSENTSFSKKQIELEKEKFKKEFELSESKFAAEYEEKKKKMELNKLEIEKEERLRVLELEKQEREKRLEIEKEERLRVLELEKQEREKRLEIEKEERLRVLELEKQERMERLEIEMRYKYGSHTGE